jgi:hypothetical protein
MLLVIVIMAIGMLVGIVIIVASQLQEQDKKYKVKQKNLVRTAKAYAFLSENFLTRKAFRSLVSQISSLSIYSWHETKSLAITYYTQTMGISVASILLSIIIFRDLTAVLFCTGFAMVLFHALIIKKIDRAHFIIVKELSGVLASIREAYTISGNIPDAINGCTKSKHLQRALDKIYLILTSTDSEDRLEEFHRTVPFPLLRTLAGTCFVMNDSGDEKDDSGQSAFKSAITLLKNDCDVEVRKLTRQRILFNSLEYLPLAPLPFIGIAEYFFIRFLPGTAVIYNGVLGYLSQTIIILSTIASYWYISNATSLTAVRRHDRSTLVDALLHWRPFQPFLVNILPKKAKTRMQIDQLIKGALSSKDIKYIYTARVMVSVIVFGVVLSLLTVFTFLAKEFTYDNIRIASFTGGNQMTVDEERRWHELDNTLLAQPKAPRERELQDIIPAYFSDITTMELKDQSMRIIDKYNKYHSLQFHWWYVLIAFGVAFLGWLHQDFLLYLRKRLVRSEEEVDILQLQTMLAVLRYTQLTTLDALYWMARQSHIYKTALYFAYHEYPSDPELALSRLGDKSQVAEFKQICERLKTTVSQVTIREAFSDLESERDHMLRIREMIQNSSIERKRRLCSPISRAPLMATVFGHVLMPIVVLAAREFISMLTQLGVM